MGEVVLVGLGSNRGDSLALMREALVRLEAFPVRGYRRSSLWRTSPVDCPPGSGDFLNAVAAFEPMPELSPELLLTRLKALEREYGRDASPVKNAPRELDLDLLIYGDERRVGPDFFLPHPRACLRRFVLAPAAELVPDLVWPGTGRSVRELLEALDSDETVVSLQK
jgi:2-amino-4-hydroxy-6-hydroxymethyldihydropteridine diphosphokinase